MQIKTKDLGKNTHFFWKNLDFKSYCATIFLQSSILFVIIVTDQSDGDKCRCLTQRDIHSTTINGFLKRARLKGCGL